ncbi:DUF1330 domain-containing protein [Pseudomonas kitaguniensis]|uniref:DUF1330 domain-containing protein n=1 Tax=Pseudomonas kitaguniensis TaxID=2607908 RepID=UPI003D07D164
MKSNVFAAMVAFASVLFVVEAAHAQVEKEKFSAYFISEFQVTDNEGIRPYREAVESTIEPYGGRFVVRGGTIESLEGDPPARVIMIAFPSMRAALDWYRSDEYQTILPIRHRSAKARVFILPGLPNET